MSCKKRQCRANDKSPLNNKSPGDDKSPVYDKSPANDRSPLFDSPTQKIAPAYLHLPHASNPPCLDGGEETTIPLDGYDRAMNHTARQIANNTMSKLHMDLDAGTEPVEEVADPMAKAVGKRMCCMVLNEDVARQTSNRFSDPPVGLDSQELTVMMDATWDKHCSPERKAPT
jgi:hypothetical protein